MDDICTYLQEMTGTVWFNSTVKNDHVYTDNNMLTGMLEYNMLTGMLEYNNIPFVISSTPFSDRIYVKIEDAYSYRLRKERDDKLNELLK